MSNNDSKLAPAFTLGGLIGLGLCAIPVFVPMDATGFVVYIGALLALHFVLAIVMGFYARRAYDTYKPEVKKALDSYRRLNSPSYYKKR